MTVLGRMLVRVAAWTTYLICSAAAFTFLISSIFRLRFISILLVLFLLDVFLHRRDGDMPTFEIPAMGFVNVAPVMRPSTYGIIERAFDAGAIARRDFFLEVLGRLIELPEIQEGMRRLNVPLKEFKEKWEDFIHEESGEKISKDSRLRDAERLALSAFAEAVSAKHVFVEAVDLFSGLARIGDVPVDRLFNIFSIEAGDLERAFIFSREARARGLGRIPEMLGGFIPETHHRVRHRVMNRAWTSLPTPTLDACSVDFTDLAREERIGFLIGHEEEYSRLVETLSRPVNPNALLIGDAGIGKEAIVQHLAFQLSKDDVPKTLFDKRLVALEIQSLVAGAPPEVLTGRLKSVIDEINMAGNIVLYIPDIHNLVKTSGQAYLSAADALMPVIMNNAFPVVGATYPKEFKQSIELRSDFIGAFEQIHVNEISPADAEKILTYESLIIEKQSRVEVSFGAIKQAVGLAKKYIHGKFLPASAEELLKSAVVEAERTGEKQIGPELVTAVVESKTHIPIREAGGAEADNLLHLEEIIHRRFIDQEEAVKAIATALREYRSGLSRRGGPIASFLFVGPTGVGKTELAKILADLQFGSEKMMTRFDMTEYQDKPSLIRFIGSPDGSTRGALTDAVIEKPYGLILLDEFEKAHPDILNLFLQVFDDGRLTDGLGRTADFTNTILIATSNAHSDIINDALGKGESMADIAEYLKARLVDVFKPELINRFSKLVVFKNLGSAELAKIVELNLKEFSSTLSDQGIAMEFDQSVISALVKLGYDPAFGARPLRRAIEEYLRAPLAEEILAKKITKGMKVRAMYVDGTFRFQRK